MSGGVVLPSSPPLKANASVFVFLGPSLPLADARRILPDAVYLPPVSMGDVYRLMSSQPSVIAIIDGLFEQTPAVWHKEILFALSRGVRVLGASSMGALRAAELSVFGMEGVGEVFEAFHGGVLEDDDEVAVAHAPAADGYRSLSDAMVNIRAGLRAARDAGRITVTSHDRLVGAAKDLFYPDRSWPRLFQLAAAMGIAAGELTALREQIARQRPDVKRADAIRLLEMLATDKTASPAITSPAPRVASFDFEPTFFWEQMILNEAVVAAPGDGSADGSGDGSGGDSVGAADLRRHVRVHGSRADQVLEAALLLYLADEQASRRGLASAADGREGDAPGQPASTVSAGAALLSPAESEVLGRGRRAAAALQRAVPDQVNRRLAAALAHLGRLDTTLVEVRRKQVILRGLGLHAATPADAGLGLDDLLDWYRRQFGPWMGSPEAHAVDLGFASFEEFVGEIVLEYLAHLESRVIKTT